VNSTMIYWMYCKIFVNATMYPQHYKKWGIE
jgi:hypothetical protein